MVSIKPSRVGGISPSRKLRDLCVEAGIPVDIEDTGLEPLRERIRAYNEAVRAGEDPAYGKPILDRRCTLEPPYYAIRMWPKVHYTVGGLRIDAQARVLDAHGAALSGLFAAGEVTGGVHGGLAPELHSGDGVPGVRTHRGALGRELSRARDQREALLEPEPLEAAPGAAPAMRPRRSLVLWLTMFALITAAEVEFLLPFASTRVFRPTLLDALAINNFELGVAQSVYGVVAMISYFAGGPLADRFSARRLMATAMAQVESWLDVHPPELQGSRPSAIDARSPW